MSVEERFLAKIEVIPFHPCWEWVGAKHYLGYGGFRVGGRKGRTLRANRVAYELWVGPIPEGLLVLHRCDNPSCVRPEHLFAGTVRENAQDMVRKKRHRWGLNRPSASATL